MLSNPPPVYQRDYRPPDIAASTTGNIIRQISQASTIESKLEPESLTVKEYAWSGYEDDPVPEKTQGHYIRNLRHQIFSLYRRLFGVVFVTNMAIFIATCIRGANAQQIGTIVLANLLCAVLMRQDYVVNAFFNVFCSVPTSYESKLIQSGLKLMHVVLKVAAFDTACLCQSLSYWRPAFRVCCLRRCLAGPLLWQGNKRNDRGREGITVSLYAYQSF